MKKGEIKKQEILKTAETLFCKYGYESTGVQAILDELQTSKGSFYHHFVSKEALLEEICRQRAYASFNQLISTGSGEDTPLETANKLISGIIPFTGVNLSFLLMLLPVLNLPEGMQIRNAFGRELEKLYVPHLTEALQTGTEQEIFLCRDAAFSAEMTVLLVNDFWLRICDMILANEKSGTPTDSAELMKVCDAYRQLLERILEAPCGSIELILLPELSNLIGKIHLHFSQKTQEK